MSAAPASPKAVTRAVFVCGRNSVRSPMAEALWRARFGEDAPAVSCGVAPATYADGFMIAVMAETGADLSSFECRDLAHTAIDADTLVVCLAEEACDEARRLAGEAGARFEDWRLPDPAIVEGGRETKLDAYRAVRDELARRIAGFERETGHGR